MPLYLSYDARLFTIYWQLIILKDGNNHHNTWLFSIMYSVTRCTLTHWPVTVPRSQCPGHLSREQSPMMWSCHLTLGSPTPPVISPILMSVAMSTLLTQLSSITGGPTVTRYIPTVSESEPWSPLTTNTSSSQHSQEQVRICTFHNWVCYCHSVHYKNSFGNFKNKSTVTLWNSERFT